MLASLLRSLIARRPSASASAAVPLAAPVDPNGIVFITHAGDQAYSPLASTRLRVLIPAREIGKHAPVSIVAIEDLRRWDSLCGGIRPKAVVIGKLGTVTIAREPETLQTLLTWLRTYSMAFPVLADISDNYAARSQFTNEPIFENLLAELGSRCKLTVPCRALGEAVRPYARQGIEVIEDPWESPRLGAPRDIDTHPLRLLWFGVVTPPALPPLEHALRNISRRHTQFDISIEFVTNPQHAPLLLDLLAKIASGNPRIAGSVTPWSPEATWAAIDRCDIVLLPQDTGSAWGSAKSHNRLVESIRGGRLALASPIPAYQELADFAWVGDDLAEGLQWALAHPAEVRARIRAGQQAIAHRFSPERIARRWLDVLDAIGTTAEAVVPTKAQAGQPIRLNLGCGDKILPGYVNVDVAPSRGGKAPDVLCDLHSLDMFEDGSVDEVMAIHVVEHFWRWEAASVLREWQRVLRPGGRMILECPNLLSACAELLRDPVAGASADAAGQRTMWVLYGDPAWQDPLMCHRWGYTPESLARLMGEVGLVNVRQEPAQFKLREPRDMRLVGEKPR